jgi:twitching motility two-component system response regulator PilH
MPAALSSSDEVACVAATKILVVDDSPTQRFFIADLLQRRGYQVVTAGDGDEALAKIRTERPALIVMDVVMPGRSGFQMTRALTRDPATQEIPVILCTTKSTDTDRIWGLRQGAREYVVKPVDAEELLAKIADLVH